MRAIVAGVALVAACKAAPSAPAGEPLANFVRRPPPAEVCTVAGSLVDRRTREPLAGATVILDGAPTQAEIAITDERGQFSIRSIGTQQTLTVYYLDTTWQRPLTGWGCGRRVEAAIEIRPSGPIIVW